MAATSASTTSKTNIPPIMGGRKEEGMEIALKIIVLFSIGYIIGAIIAEREREKHYGEDDKRNED